ncbi:MAG: MBL fold metallo-hydrolase [Pyrinomonadaceae bacterium]
MSNASNSSSIRIRMYRVGFGDCFLVSLPVSGGSRHILVDCGVHGKGNIGTMDEVIDNIAAVTDNKLAIVIATHAHQDHISGFDGEKFGKFEIGEVWMPWTENPKDALAVKLRKKHAALAAQLDSHFAAQAFASGQETKSRVAAAAAVANLVANKSALQSLHTGFGVNASVRFFTAGDSLASIAGIPGLSVSVLSPPRDEKFLSKMDPPAGQSYLRLDGRRVESANQLRPLSSKWEVKQNARALKHLRLSDVDKKSLQDDLSGDAADGLAFTLDKAVNNTSLVLLFTFRGQSLLFPGDAQYGNWQSWLEKEDAADILSRVTFLKVAHHGSHNATPKNALERMATGKFAAMVSTQNVPWKTIPRLPLVDRLMEQTRKRTVRSDSLALKDKPKAPKGPAVSKLPPGFSRGDFWYDYLIKL